jgi:hypothetical protein
VDESATEWEKPEKGQKERESCNDLRIDEADFGSVAIALITDALKISAGDTSYDGCKSELKNSQHLLKEGWLVVITYLANAEDHTEDIVYEMHLDRVS